MTANDRTSPVNLHLMNKHTMLILITLDVNVDQTPYLRIDTNSFESFMKTVLVLVFILY